MVAATSSGYGALAQGQSKRDEPFSLKPPKCIERVDPVNEDGSLLKPERLLDLERRHTSAPADDAIAKELRQELFDLAQHMMFCSPADPPRKYPLAYCLYGRVLELDESHKAARDGRAMIESIYKSLRKSPPECDCR